MRSRKMNRQAVIALLQRERGTVYGRYSGDEAAEVSAMYDYVIDVMDRAMLQNRTGKLVRMADGTRKWFPNKEARRMLKRPREERYTEAGSVWGLDKCREKGCRYGDCKAYCEKHTECIHCEDAWLFGAMPDKDCFEEAEK